MYSADKGCIFVHQRKSAGTSIKTLFPDATEEFGSGRLDPGWADDPRVAASFKFTVIRNPWDRFISGWKYLRSTRNLSVEDVLRNLPRENILDNILGTAPLHVRSRYLLEYGRKSGVKARRILRNAVTRSTRRIPQISGHNHRHISLQQHETVVNRDGTLAVDAVLFLEALDEGLAFLSSRVDIDPGTIPRRNVARQGDDYRAYFDDRTRALFNEKFAADVRLWGYAFDRGPGCPPSQPILTRDTWTGMPGDAT